MVEQEGERGINNGCKNIKKQIDLYRNGKRRKKTTEESAKIDFRQEKKQ